MKPELICLPKIVDPRGNLSFLESNQQVPFEIKRTYWLYDVPGGINRNGHAYKENQEFIVALSGAFDVVCFDGELETRYHLNRSYFGLYIPNMVWRELENFSTNSVALIVNSENYQTEDYIRELNDYSSRKNN